MSIVVKVVGFALALTLSVGVPVQTAQAVHSSGSGSGTKYEYRDHFYFNYYDRLHSPSRVVTVDFKSGGFKRYENVFFTYDGYTLEIYDWDTGKKIATFVDTLYW